MDKNIVKGTRTITDITGVTTNDGQWKVTVLITQKRTLDGENWESKEISSTSFNEDFNRALLSCNFTIQTYLESLDFNLFNEKKDESTNDIKN